MPGQKRRNKDNHKGYSSSKKRSITKRTVEKWKAENDKSIQTLRWLHFEMSSDREHATLLKCDVCSRFKDKLVSMRNYRPAFIDRTANIRAPMFKDHVATAMHCRAMLLVQKETESSVVEYSRIAKALAQANSNETTKAKLKRKFDVAYMVVKENLSFMKMKSICELEERHGTDLGAGYKHDHSCSTSVEFIACEQLVTTVPKFCFFSLQAKSSPDSGNTENKLFMILHLDP